LGQASVADRICYCRPRHRHWREKGVFSVVNALLLRSLPFREPDRLALLHGFIPPHDTAKQFHEWRRQSTYLADAALFEK
jgi:hypothetical protein